MGIISNNFCRFLPRLNRGNGPALYKWPDFNWGSCSHFFGQLYIMPQNLQKFNSRLVFMKFTSLNKIQNRHIFRGSQHTTFKLIENKDIDHFSVLRYLKARITLYYVSSVIDKTFSVNKFLVDSPQAVSAISDTLVTGRVSDLEGILTPECLKEVKENISRLSIAQRSLIPLKMDGGTTAYILDATVVNNTSTTEEKILTISVIFNQISIKSPSVELKQYFVGFTRIFTDNSKSSWLISDLNIHYNLFR